MSPAQKRKYRRFWALLLILFVVSGSCFYFLPSVIHIVYSNQTSQSERESQLKRYQNICEEECRMTISTNDYMLLNREKDKIFYWFHARGWNIDEGWHENTFGEKVRHWKDLYAYWTH